MILVENGVDKLRIRLAISAIIRELSEEIKTCDSLIRKADLITEREKYKELRTEIEIV